MNDILVADTVDDDTVRVELDDETHYHSVAEQLTLEFALTRLCPGFDRRVHVKYSDPAAVLIED